MKFWIINRVTGRSIMRSTPGQVGTYFLGRRTSEYILVKSDDKGDRVVNLSYAIILSDLEKSAELA